MKKFLGVLAVAAVLTALALPSQAQGFYNRADGAAVVKAGTGSYTNDRTYEPIELKRVWLMDCLVTNQVVTLTRVDLGGAITQAVGSVNCALLSAGNTASFTAAYLRPGDSLVFTPSIATGYSYRVEYEIQGLK